MSRMMVFLCFLVLALCVDANDENQFDLSPERGTCILSSKYNLICTFQGKGTYSVRTPLDVLKSIERISFDRLFKSELNLNNLPNLRRIEIKDTDFECDKFSNLSLIAELNGQTCLSLTTSGSESQTSQSTLDVYIQTTSTPSHDQSTLNEQSTSFIDEQTSHSNTNPDTSTKQSTSPYTTDDQSVSFSLDLKVFIPLVVIIIIIAIIVLTSFLIKRKIKQRRRRSRAADIELSVRQNPPFLFEDTSIPRSNYEDLFEIGSSSSNSETEFKECR